jgi:hypothetical protein
VHLFVGNVVDADIADRRRRPRGTDAAAGHVSHLPAGGDTTGAAGMSAAMAHPRERPSGQAL